DLPTEVDDWANTNNMLHVGSLARHNNVRDLPTEVDEWGNTNNVLHVGSLACHTNDAVRERVIERPLTDLERRMVTFASQRVAFSVSPITFTPKLRPARS
ncbi:unnamed protein product, partial [Closterium sp. NIES-65]